jgi:multidrug efflux pump subunit AcrA (membrane-fusion protein)
MKFVYLDKKDRVGAWFTRGRSLAIVAGLLALLILPLWHESTTGRFVLEPIQRSIIRTQVPGTVTDVYASEGLSVAPGTPLMRLRNLPLQSKMDESRAAYQAASTSANTALLHYADLGMALRERDSSDQQRMQWESQASFLELSSPFVGVVLTPHLKDRLGAFLPEGTEVAEVADLRQMRARMYVSEHDMFKFLLGSPAKLHVDGFIRKWKSKVGSIAAASSQSDPRVTEQTQYSGLNPPMFYVIDLGVPNLESLLKPGMVGTARIYGTRRSLAGLAWKGVAEFFGRKLW